MQLSISTHWNTFRHSTGEAMIQENLDAGFNRVELGYDLTLDLVEGVQNMVNNHSVSVGSVHNYCPVPMGVSAGHPELFFLSSLDSRVQEGAISHTTKTIRFAETVGAKHVVVHAGRVDMRHLTFKLIKLAEQGKQYEAKYEKTKNKLYLRRDRKAQKHLDALYRSVERLLPVLVKSNVTMAMENLPSWETVPCEAELEKLIQHFDSPHIRFWYDSGHGKVRQNLGFISSLHWLERLKPVLAGMHIHDVTPPAYDHLMPPDGKTDFSQLEQFITDQTEIVLEPAPGTPTESVIRGAQIIRETFNITS